MKKARYILAAVILVAISTACGPKIEHSPNSVASVNDVIAAQMALKDGKIELNQKDDSEQATKVPQKAAASVTSTDADRAAADVDLTELSSTMIYAEVYNMVTMPLVYHGKTVKLTGYYDEYYDALTDRRYCSVFVMDALACCAEGLSLQFSEDYLYPDDYPEDGGEITIYATFEIYYPEEDSTDFYYHLVDAIILE